MTDAKLTVETLDELSGIDARLPEMAWRGCVDHPAHNSNPGCWGIYANKGEKLRLLDIGQDLVALRAAIPSLIAAARASLESRGDLENVSSLVHESWMTSKRSAGVESRKLESGEELMVPYSQLSEEAKELDRVTVRTVLAAMHHSAPSQPAESMAGWAATAGVVAEAVIAHLHTLDGLHPCLKRAPEGDLRDLQRDVAAIVLKSLPSPPKVTP